MKLLCIVLALVALACADEEWKPKTKDEVKSIRAECLEEHPLSAAAIEKMKHFEFPNEPEVRQYLLCTAKKMNIFCEHMGYHPDRIAQQFRTGIPESEVLEIATNCSDKNDEGSPIDEWAFRVHQCFLNSKVGDMMKAFIKKKKEEERRGA